MAKLACNDAHQHNSTEQSAYVSPCVNSDPICANCRWPGVWRRQRFTAILV